MSTRTPLVMVAPNGARHGKDAHPAIPVTEAEIVETAIACQAAGAGAIHFHIRDGNGAHWLDVDSYNAAVAAIRRATGDNLLVQATTEAVGRYNAAEVAEIIERVDAPAFSVAMRELIPAVEDESLAAATLTSAVRRSKAIQHILYSPEELQRFVTLVERGIVPDDNLDVLFVLGRYGAGDTDPQSLLGFLDVFLASPIAAKAEWMVCAFGPPETRALSAALALGGKVRIGFENNFHHADGSVASDNAMRVASIVEIATLLGIIEDQKT